MDFRISDVLGCKDVFSIRVWKIYSTPQNYVYIYIHTNFLFTGSTLELGGYFVIIRSRLGSLSFASYPWRFLSAYSFFLSKGCKLPLL